MDNSAFPSDLMSQLSLESASQNETQPQGESASNETSQNEVVQQAESASTEVSRLSQMVDDLGEKQAASATVESPNVAETSTAVSQVATATSAEPGNKLGVASNLFRSIKQKHVPTAEHGMRVALGCSVWSTARGDSEEYARDLEVSALLHDIGKIGVPGELLAKPGKLTEEEHQLMSRHRLNGLDILSNCNYPPQILQAVAYSSAWFDGSKGKFKVSGRDLPLAARMLSIVDAFDSMTTDQVYRRAMSVERAMAELFQCAGTQFDPELVASFCSTVAGSWVSLRQSAGQRWIAQMGTGVKVDFWNKDKVTKPATAHAPVVTQQTPAPKEQISNSELFHRALVDHLPDGVMYVGERQRIAVWNRALERMTGISSSSVRDKRWLPSLVEMRYEHGREAIQDADCPIAMVFQSGQQLAKRVSIMGRGKKYFSADILVVPVTDTNGSVIGATVTIHDVSSKLSLEERVESLYTKVTQDQLTKVANRAEFDRSLAEFVSNHMRDGLPCSLIITDIDFFKKINDDFGHQAGDQALISFAALLKRFQHIGDLVARYGGEEFVLLCADCDNATATARAEEIRQILQSTPQTVLDNKCLTSSFGVTEIQAGDTPDSMLRRADRALLMAKEQGRNKVVQLGTGYSNRDIDAVDRKSFFSWFKSPSGDRVCERTLITHVPIDLAIEKLKGFVSDQYAQITSVDENVIQMRADGHSRDLSRRKSDRPVPFMISMNFSKLEPEETADGKRKALSRTQVEIIIEPIRSRDRRRNDLRDRADMLVRSLKAYLMASDEKDDERPMLERAATESGRDE